MKLLEKIQLLFNKKQRESKKELEELSNVDYIKVKDGIVTLIKEENEDIYHDNFNLIPKDRNGFYIYHDGIFIYIGDLVDPSMEFKDGSVTDLLTEVPMNQTLLKHIKTCNRSMVITKKGNYKCPYHQFDMFGPNADWSRPIKEWYSLGCACDKCKQYYSNF